MTRRNEMWDANYQQIYAEAIENENKLRTKWFLKNKQRLIDNLSAENGSKLIKKKLKRLREANAQWEIKEPPSKLLREENFVSSSPCKLDHVVANYMRPVDPKVLDILYEKSKESHEARKNYLRERYKTRPEDKFYITDCTSWLYGWHLKDFPPVTPAELGQSSIIKDTFYRRNISSLQRDPALSRRPQVTNAKNLLLSLD